jgi:hypothetical protein
MSPLNSLFKVMSQRPKSRSIVRPLLWKANVRPNKQGITPTKVMGIGKRGVPSNWLRKRQKEIGWEEAR